MPRLRLFLLGAPQIELDGALITLNRRKDLALLAYLAVTAESHTRETLAALLWPDFDTSHAFANLRRSIYEINKILGEWLEAGPQTLAIRRGPELWLDIEAFQSLIAESDNPDRLNSLQDAVALYRGDFMTGFNLRDSTGFEEWQFFTAAEFRRDFSHVLEELTDEYLELRDIDQAIQIAQRWLKLDTLHEPAHRKLMQLHAMSGDRSAAIRQYQQSEKILDRELGVQPDDETKRLLEDIQMGKLDSKPKPAGEDQLSKINLPVPPTPFIGRETELERIRENLLNPDCRLLNLHGPGGIGKTRLAIQAAQESADQFPQGIYFVPLVTLNSRQSIIQTIACTLGFNFRPEKESPQDQLLGYLQHKRLLLVLDNFEHLVSEAGFLNDISQSAQGLKFIVTSRERLQMRMEWVFEVGGMDYPPPSRPSKSQIKIPSGTAIIDEETLLEYNAIRLFLNAAERAQAEFDLTTEDYQAVVRITQLVDGIPLALELAAAWVSIFNPHEIANQIERSLDFLETTIQDIPERQRNLRAVFDQSWNLLDEREQSFISSLSVFQGGFNFQAATEIFSISPQELLTLVSKSFLQRSDIGRFELHPLIRQYANEKLNEDQESNLDALDRHSVFFCSLTNKWAEEIKGPEQKQILIEFVQDLDNILCAWSWAVERKNTTMLSNAVEGLCLFFNLRVRYNEALEICRRGAETFAEPESDEEMLILAQLLAWGGFFAQSLSDFESAAELHQRSLDILEQLDMEIQQESYAKALNYFGLGLVAHFFGNGERAKHYFERSLKIYQALEDSYWSADVLARLANTSTYLLWDNVSGEQYRTKSLEIRLSLGDQFNVARLQYDRAVIAAYHTGDLNEAQRLFMKSSQIYNQLDVPYSRALELTCLGQIACLNGRFEETIQHGKKLIQIFEELGDRKNIAWTHILLCLDHIYLGDYQQAMTHSRLVFDNIQGRTEEDIELGIHHWNLGNLYLIQGNYEKAKELFLNNVDTFRKVQAKHGLGRDLAGLSRAEYGLGDIASAWKYCLEALNLFMKYRHYDWMLYALASLALLFAQKGSIEQALEIEGLVTCHPVMAKSRLYEDLYWKEINAKAASLPPETIEAALSRGREADPWETLEQIVNSLASGA